MQSFKHFVLRVYRQVRSFVWIEDAWRDAGYAARTLRKMPGFTMVAVVTLALGVGSVTVIYSVVRNVLLDPFPYSHSDRMVDVVVRDSSNRILRGALPPAEFLDYQEQSQAFEDVMGTIVEEMHYAASDGAERLDVAWMTPNGFTFLGVAPLLGRVFGPADAAANAPRVAVLNHRTWLGMFGGDPSVVGRTVVLNGEPRTIIGVMPPRFEWHVADLWIPGPINRTDPPSGRSLRWFQARLRSGVTVEEAEAQFKVIAARRVRENPQDYPEGSRIQVITVIDWVVGGFRQVLYTLFAAVGLLLVIACCNVANMLLARATAREREITVRTALGASRGRIVRQLIAESAMLAFGGAVGGCLLAYAGIAALARLMPRQGVAWETELRLDQPVLIFALCTTVVATVAFGLFPAYHSTRRELIAGANAGGRGGSASRRQTRMRDGLVVAEVALSIVLLVGAGLLMRTFIKLAQVDLGFDPRNVLIAGVAFPPGHSESAGERQQFYRQAVERAGAIPGVLSASVTSALPPFGGIRSPIEVPGGAPEEQPSTIVNFCSDGFFETIGLRLATGRLISAADVEGSRQVAVVNEALVRRYFGGQSPLGRSFRLTRLRTIPNPVMDPTFEVVGVVRDIANQGIRQPPAPQAFVPFTLRVRASYLVVTRTSGEPLGMARVVRHEIGAVDRQVALTEPRTFEDVLQRSYYAQPRFSLIVLGMFACTGLALVALGVYGVLAYTVSQQTREIAIRMAVGGQPRHVRSMVFRMGLRLIGAGIVTGLAASVATNRLLVNQLWNTSPHDATTQIAAVVVVVTIGIVSCSVPARRALRVDPIVALRHE
jgi:putative ABC transport system permease protein